jgi:hypothetical protein
MSGRYFKLTLKTDFAPARLEPDQSASSHLTPPERVMDYSACWPVPLPFAGLIAAASSARFFIHSSYSGVPRRGGTSLGIPPIQVGTLSATAALPMR